MHNPMSLAGRTIVVTGAGQGIGRALSEMCLELGANVALIERNGETLAKAMDEIGSTRTLALQGDVSDESFGGLAVKRCISHFGSVHGLVNNAGITRPALAEKMTLQQWQSVIDVNLTGCFLMLQAVGRHMVERASAGDETQGSIVNIASIAGKRGSLGQLNYAAAKAGLYGMTMTTAREWARYQIRCNSVGFGTIETPMTEVVRGERFRERTLATIPLGRFGRVDEATPMVCFLLSNAASFITGQNISVCGGAHLQP